MSASRATRLCVRRRLTCRAITLLLVASAHPKKHCRRQGTVCGFDTEAVSWKYAQLSVCHLCRRRAGTSTSPSLRAVHALLRPVSSSSSPQPALGAPTTGSTRRKPAAGRRAPSARRSRLPRRCAAVASPSHPPQEQLRCCHPAKRVLPARRSWQFTAQLQLQGHERSVCKQRPSLVPGWGSRVKLANRLGSNVAVMGGARDDDRSLACDSN